MALTPKNQQRILKHYLNNWGLISVERTFGNDISQSPVVENRLCSIQSGRPFYWYFICKSAIPVGQDSGELVLALRHCWRTQYVHCDEFQMVSVRKDRRCRPFPGNLPFLQMSELQLTIYVNIFDNVSKVLAVAERVLHIFLCGVLISTVKRDCSRVPDCIYSVTSFWKAPLMEAWQK